MAQRVDLVTDEGSRVVIIVQVTVEWLADLTGYSARGWIRESQSLPGTLNVDLAPYMSVQVGQSTVTIDLPANRDWSDWDKGFYELELFDGDPTHDVRFLQGSIRVDREVTGA